MTMKRLTAALLLAATTSLALTGSAFATPLLSKNGISALHIDNVVDVRWRGRHHGYSGHRGWQRGYHHRGPGWGPALGGLAAGAVIGGAIANSSARASSDDAYCSRRFKSYDPASGTYLGYDGDRHPCP